MREIALHLLDIAENSVAFKLNIHDATPLQGAVETLGGRFNFWKFRHLLSLSYEWQRVAPRAR